MKSIFGSVLLVFLCSACDPKGLDLTQPSDARQYVQACARGAEAIYCRAMLPTLAATTGEITVILPNTGDHEIAAALHAYIRQTGNSDAKFENSSIANAYARANIFQATQLKTGVMNTLDGKSHTIVCGQDPNDVELCIIDNQFSGRNRLADYPNSKGSVYRTYDDKEGKPETAFLKF